MRCILALALGLFAAGCVPMGVLQTPPPGSLPVSPVEMRLPASPMATLDAAVLGFADTRYSVWEVDRERLTVRSAGVMGDTAWGPGTRSTFVVLESFVRVSVAPVGDGSRVLIRMFEREYRMTPSGLQFGPEHEVRSCERFPEVNRSCETASAYRTEMEVLRQRIEALTEPTG